MLAHNTYTHTHTHTLRLLTSMRETISTIHSFNKHLSLYHGPGAVIAAGKTVTKDQEPAPMEVFAQRKDYLALNF